jgi:methyl-accepting chemotaxis protein
VADQSAASSQQLAAATTQTTESAHQIADVSSELASSTAGLQQLVARFAVAF